MIAVWLTGTPEENPAKARWKIDGIKAIREANLALGAMAQAGLRWSKEAFDVVAQDDDAEVFLGHVKTAADAEAVIKILRTGGCDGEARDDPAADFAEAEAEALNEAATDEPEPPAEAEEAEPASVSYQATQVAAILLAVNDGEPLGALQAAGSIQRVLDGDDLWPEVTEFLLDTFPPPKGVTVLE